MSHPLQRPHPAGSLLALALCLALSPCALAQSTTGMLFGSVPDAGAVIHIESASGVARDLSADAAGHYRSPNLPIGDYVVTLMREGAAVETRKVQVRVGTSTEVSFGSAGAGQATTLDAVNVSAASIPPIDTTATDSRTVIDAEQLRKLPLGRTSEDIAKLAPGVVANSGGFSSPTGRQLVSFGGSSPTENAYYINGFNTTEPLQAFGGLTLPYGVIDQQEMYTGGYSAQYGRSDGGVINAIGKHGTNEWHYGAQVVWEPDFLRSKGRSSDYGNGQPSSAVAGSLYSYKGDDRTDGVTTSLYAGGPIVRDTLFVFAGMELERSNGTRVDNVEANSSTSYLDYSYRMPRGYAKVNWNITDNHILELTGVSDKRKTSGTYYAYDYVGKQRGSLVGPADDTESGGSLWVAKYTGYLTDALTLTAMYGEMDTKDYIDSSAYDPSLTYLAGLPYQNPALNDGAPIGNNQTVSAVSDPDRGNHSSNLRLDLSWVIGAHTLSAGIDNLRSIARKQGDRSSGPGYIWQYGYTPSPSTALNSELGVGALADYANGASGYYVQKNSWSGIVSISSAQKAQYLEDKWQATRNLLLTLGVRNDQFTNFNSDGVAYIRQTKPQWAPRLGAAWDVHGDASLKVYANAGRYYLGLPLNPALVVAAGLYNTTQYFTYSGIAADGTPTGLTAVSGVVSALNQYGQAPDPKTTTAQGLESEYQDEYILGFEKTLGSSWVYGVKGTFRNLRNAIDDFCSMSQVVAKAQSLGYDIQNYNSCYLINPGRSNAFLLVDATGNYVQVPMSNTELGFPRLKRRYYALENVLEHPFNGSWYGKISYTFSRSYGNTEGQVRSDVSQSGTSTSYDWDNWTIMANANGPQNNDHTHQLKLFGYYQVAPAWMVSGNASLVSGTPKHCLSYYGSDQTDPLSYGSVYHFCNGQPSPPGKQGRMPWVKQFDVGVSYMPAFADHRLNITLGVFNLFNAQTPLQRYAFSMISPDADDPSPNNPLYDTVIIRQSPRYARLSVSYDY
ncbi:TonB-dependent receptor [Xanthomonas campestris pv. phormiicola]|nr:TonB-dependent receptor [Xanthomonas campestris pv. phormiicola]UYC17523.1 TonB-dependent receptor [Xanthomonas campestris pv. phormiicola]